MKLDKALEINKSKYTTQQYKFISELIWGGVPVNRKEAEESSLFKANADKILEEYPKLDVSFFEKHKNDKEFDEEDENWVKYLTSDKFKEDFAKQVENDTWGQGKPKIYMNKEGQIVEHWKDGTINIIKDKES
jgi:hypothetical protein